MFTTTIKHYGVPNTSRRHPHVTFNTCMNRETHQDPPWPARTRQECSHAAVLFSSFNVAGTSSPGCTWPVESKYQWA